VSGRKARVKVLKGWAQTYEGMIMKIIINDSTDLKRTRDWVRRTNAASGDRKRRVVRVIIRGATS